MIEVKSITFKTIPPQQFVKKIGIDTGGRTMAFLINEVRRYADPYVPMRNGPLKNTAITTPTEIIYVQPYAKRQYYTHKSTVGRGRRWIERMLKEKQRAITSAVETYMRTH